MSEFFTGVVSSLAATAIGGVGYYILWPMYVDRAWYRGARVDGVWDIVEVRSGEESTVGKITLMQKGKIVTGTGERKKTRDGNESERKFNYKGRFSGEQLTLIFQDARGEDFDSGSYIFRLQTNGRELIGMATFHGKKENRIVAEKRLLRKAVN